MRKKKPGRAGANRYFYDTYAVLAYLSGDKKYKSYFEKADGVLSVLNLMEIHYSVLKAHGTRAASEALHTFSKYMIDFGLAEIEESMKLRLKLKKKGVNLSYADAVGYYLSKKTGTRFLTGDSAFRDLPRVEFIA